MNNILNPKTVAIAQTIFYSLAAYVIPQIVSALGAGGALSSVLPAWFTNYGIAAGLIVALNFYDNKISSQTGGGLFGTIS